jgi:hypothetical protein
VSHDNYSTAYYLTRVGWRSKEEEVPACELMEIWEKDTYRGSGFGRESSTWRRLWSAPGFSDEESLRLRERFPFPERPRITEDLFKNLMRREQKL